LVKSNNKRAWQFKHEVLDNFIILYRFIWPFYPKSTQQEQRQVLGAFRPQRLLIFNIGDLKFRDLTK